MENTPLNKAKFFAQYLRCDIVIPKTGYFAEQEKYNKPVTSSSPSLG